MSATLEIRGVAKRYGDVAALAEVTFDVAAGEFLSLLGPSGCGKTTLLRLIAGFAEPDAGSIAIAGRPMRGVPAAARNLGLVFQNYSLWPHMTVAENVAFGLDCRRVRGAERRDRVAQCLDLVRLGALADRLPRELSGGQQQRVALARALAYRPSLLLLDEPLSALDRKLRLDLQEELRRLRREVGVTTILVTHDQEEALALSDRIAVMNAGRIEQIGAAEIVYKRPSTAFVASFVGRANLVPGRVEVGPQGTLRFVSDLGPEAPLAGEFSVSQRLRAVVRPECVRVCPPLTPGALPAVVIDSAFHGGSVSLKLRLDSGATLLATVNSTSGKSTPHGEAVGVCLDLDGAFLFDQEA